jgi:hypothetical protein
VRRPSKGSEGSIKRPSRFAKFPRRSDVDYSELRQPENYDELVTELQATFRDLDDATVPTDEEIEQALETAFYDVNRA